MTLMINSPLPMQVPQASAPHPGNPPLLRSSDFTGRPRRESNRGFPKEAA